MRRAAKVDANHGVIREAYKAHGFSVLDIYQLKECADIVVAKYGICDVVEVKDGRKVPSKRRLTEGEIKFHQSWNAKVWVVESVEDVMAHAADVQRRWDAMP